MSGPDLVIVPGPDGGLEVVKRLLDVMAEVDHIGKDGWNNHQSFAFRGVDQIVDVVGPLLRKHRVLPLPQVTRSEHREVEVGAKRTPMCQAIVHVRYCFVAEDGSVAWTELVGESNDSGDKATTKALSQAYKYLWNQALCIPTNEPDPDSETSARTSPDDAAREAGFRDEKARNKAHADAADAVKALPEDLRGPMRDYRAEHGWPLTAVQLRCFEDLIADAQAIQLAQEEPFDAEA